MLDLIFVVNNSNKWHAENMTMNPHHYAQPLRLFGPNIISKFQETWGAKLYYNTLIKTNDNRLIKYGVVTEDDIVEDLLDWNFMYLAGRLHKPVEILIEPDDNSQLRTALVQNLQSAVHAALLLLPENFTELDFYKKITGLSYNGDFHTSPIARIYHLNQLPRIPQIELVRMWKHGSRLKDAEDCLRVIAHDPECSEILKNVFEKIVWKSSVSQSLKGIATAGIGKSIKYI
ncbi:phosphatidate cytidylyltransferase, mitochondrial [Aphidius gifuensis]|uniref:phosphatidate cytidylyltransferase, mitochondrial n=1 Tax=Aphidius gifuensis TaxID=684658 RepID=UPI001CDB6EDC|nr:phosphatidate cytidylyltransferase, mitochondrial [Aphidius gifuensis]